MANITVNIADFKSGKAPDMLVTYALGSCIGISIYDKLTHIGALGHIMLPGEDLEKTKDTPMRFATSCIPMMLDALAKLGCSKANMEARIAGGANIITFSNESSLNSIGFRNATAVRKTLLRQGIRIVGEDIGKDYARTMFLNPGTGEVTIKTYGNGNYKI